MSLPLVTSVAVVPILSAKSPLGAFNTTAHKLHSAYLIICSLLYSFACYLIQPVAEEFPDLPAVPSRCVVSKNIVLIFRRLVAGEARFMHRFVGRFAIYEFGVPPAARCGVFF